ncbi:MAG: trimethylamine methyltransferase family protein [Armatimonadetes bacterium]|nr:trimethylamine methyltransferase family protein [Armatimonadota bacterium]
MDLHLAPETIAPWVGRIVDGACHVLEHKGMLVHHESLRESLRHVPGVQIDGSRGRFSEELSRGFLDAYRQMHPFRAPEGYSLSAGCHALHIHDTDGALRPITLADIQRGTRLVAALAPEGIHGIAPGIPQDVPPKLRSLAQLIATAKNRAGRPGHVPIQPETESYNNECYRILGYEPSAGVHIISPLRFEGQEVDTALALRKLRPDCSVGVGTMPIIGVSAPASLLAGFTVALADVLGGALVFHHTGTPLERIGIWVNAYPFDMRQGCFVYGEPANIACSLLEREVNRYLGTEVSAKSFSVMAQTPGAHACALKGAFTGMMVSQGRRLFSGAGVLSLDEVYSPVQLIYDRELFRFVRRAEEMLDIGLVEEALMVDEIIDSEEFLTADSTLAHFRDLQWDSRIFAPRMVEQWRVAGSPSEHEAAVAEIERLLAEYEFELDDHKSRALDEVYTRAERELA